MVDHQRLWICSVVVVALVGCHTRSSRPPVLDPGERVGDSAARSEISTTGDPSDVPDATVPQPPTRASNPRGVDPAVRTAHAPFVQKGVAWLVEAQHEGGGWGAGSHSAQQIRDPRQVVTDPATTAFAATALLRAGHTPVSGDYRDAVRRAAIYLCECVERSADEGPRITDLSGTQPQAKLGPLVDTSMTLQFLSRVLPTIPENDDLSGRIDRAATKCLTKLQSSQEVNGSWGGGGWAPVLQSALGCGALEYARAAGKSVDARALEKARQYQKRNFDADTGRASADAAAGVELYAFAGAQKASAAESRLARDLVENAKREGELPSTAEVSGEALRSLGVPAAKAEELSVAYSSSMRQAGRLANDEGLLTGFGSNGGEEFLSYMLTSESLVLQGGDAWSQWNQKMHDRLARVQSADGSWTGHHCVTSPVFCTAAVVQCLTVERDLPLLEKISEQSIVDAKTR